jgi:uncharacterized RDD family membrane protein YckC
MICPYCGGYNKDGAAFCVSCRRTLGGAPSVATPPPAGLPSAAAADSTYYDRELSGAYPGYLYAAFWTRFLAWLLDFLFGSLFAVVPGVILAVVLGLWVDSTHEDLSPFDERGRDQQEEELGWAIGGGFLLGYVPVYVAYKTIANATGGGWGKRILGLRVLRERDGAKPGFGTGFLRAIVPAVFGLLTALLWVLDKLWCIWDGRKQTWHDKIAGTVVVAVR